jgi:hypothetical protein
MKISVTQTTPYCSFPKTIMNELAEHFEELKEIKTEEQ